MVEITLYGATAATYERITGVRGSYERCLSGIRRLLERKISVRLKTILMTLNRHEFAAIGNLARAWGVKFRFDAALFPCLDGDKGPLALRVAPEEAAAKEFAQPDRVREWREYYERRKDMVLPDLLYNCGAGVTGFHVDPYGKLQPCLMTRHYQYDLMKGSFAEGWRDHVVRVREAGAGPRLSLQPV